MQELRARIHAFQQHVSGALAVAEEPKEEVFRPDMAMTKPDRFPQALFQHGLELCSEARVARWDRGDSRDVLLNPRIAWDDAEQPGRIALCAEVIVDY